jgi:3-deoxy-D-manno-octulosonic-acid transferase
MLLIYRFLLNVLFPFIILIIYLRTLLNKEDKIRFKEKLFSNSFNIRKNYKKKLIWFHAASIGEVNSIVPLIKKLNKKKQYDFLITTVTSSSARLIKKLFNEKNIIHRFFPIDKPSLTFDFLNYWSPNLIVFVDSELWPNFLLEIKRRNLPLVLLNGRITKKTFLKWKLIPSFAIRVFQTFKLCLTSNNESKKYLEIFEAKNIKYLGNLKLASENKITNLNQFNKKKLLKSKFWCAVSTHKTEEIFCLKTHLNIKKIHNKVITIIIPRHIDRVKSIKLECNRLNLKSQILNEAEVIKNETEIIIINSYGVIPNYLSICKSVFIGKSLIKKLEAVGGQNPIEAAKFGCKIYHGPFVYNFKEIYNLLKKYNISEEINNEDELSKKLNKDLSNLDTINNATIENINKLGNQILINTFNELEEVIKNENVKT